MANFKKTFEKMYGIEYTSNFDVLHHNKKEKGLTFYGIYETAHPHLEIWEYIYQVLKKVNYKTDESPSAKKAKLQRASQLLVENENLINSVKKFYYEEFWKPLKLDLIDSQKIADEMFFFYVNTGNKKKTIKMAQLVVGAVPDGFIGIETITKLNHFDETLFDRAYDLKEMEYHARLVQANPSLYLLNLVGWIRRDVRV